MPFLADFFLEPACAFFNAFGSTVDSDFGRDVPAFLRALMLSHKPFFALFFVAT